MADNRKKEFWVVCETSGDSVIRASGELLGLASRLSGRTGWRTVAVLIGAQIEQHASLLTALGAETIYLLEHPLLDHINELMVSRILSELVAEYRPEVVVLSATVHGRSIAPQVAAALRTGLTADCTGLDLDSEGLLVQTRPAFGENLIAEILCRTARPQMATVRPGVFPYPELDSKKTANVVRKLYNDPLPDNLKVLESSLYNKASGEIALWDASVIVSGGRGVGSKEGFEILENLARILGGTTGASRSAVDAGFADYSKQIGQTGVTVNPDIYIACGISGSVQHLAGMSGSGYIIAINSDPKALIFDHADYGIVGNFHEVVEKLISTLL